MTAIINVFHAKTTVSYQTGFVFWKHKFLKYRNVPKLMNLDAMNASKDTDHQMDYVFKFNFLDALDMIKMEDASVAIPHTIT